MQPMVHLLMFAAVAEDEELHRCVSIFLNGTPQMQLLSNINLHFLRFTCILEYLE